MINLDTQKVLDNLLKYIWDSDEEKIESYWKSLSDYNPCK